MSTVASAAALPLDPLILPIRKDADGSLRVGNTRVVLELVLESFRDGESPEEIVQAFPTLSLADVYALATWHLKNREPVDVWLEDCELESEELRKRLEAKHGIKPLPDVMAEFNRRREELQRLPESGISSEEMNRRLDAMKVM